jgi:hypothetical protein
MDLEYNRYIEVYSVLGDEGDHCKASSGQRGGLLEYKSVRLICFLLNEKW